MWRCGFWTIQRYTHIHAFQEYKTRTRSGELNGQTIEYLSISGPAYSIYFKESFEFLVSVDFKCLSTKDLTKLYSIVKYEDDLDVLSE